MRSLRIGRAFGIPILVHVSWLVAFGLAVVSLGHELGGTPAIRWTLATATALAFFASVLAHELAHAVVALRFGVPVRSITLFVFGGLATLGAEPRRPRDELFVAAAGPLASLVIGVAAWLLSRAVPSWCAEPVAWLGRVNVGLAVFNCLPGFPLDGGRILRAALWARSGDADLSTARAAKVGRAMAYGFLVLGAWSATSVSMASGLWTAFIGWFLLQAAQQSLDDVKLRGAVADLEAHDVMTRAYPSVPVGLDLATYVEGIVFPTGDRTHLVRSLEGIAGVVTLERVLAEPRALWRTTPLAAIATPLTDVPRVDPWTPVVDVLHALDASPVALVMDEEGVAGVVDRERLLGFVETRAMLAACSDSHPAARSDAPASSPPPWGSGISPIDPSARTPASPRFAAHSTRA